MRWKYCKIWGQARLETKKDFPGEVGMTSMVEGYMTTQVLGRLESQQSERVLGVRLPLDGNMKDEHAYRCKQVRDFSKKVYNAPLSHWDAWMIYESRYRAMIRYPLPITQSTINQCKEIQRPFINMILPKIGLNRKTPRAIIYGPRTLGGMQLMDLRVEQIAIQCETTIGHMRQLDRAGKGLFITAHDLQVEIGISTPFYHQDPEKYNYITEKTRWLYLWSNTFRMGLMMETYNF